MGESQAARWQWLGYLHFIRNRGRDTLDTIQPWVKIAMGGAFLSGYRNLGTLSAWEAVGVGAAIIIGAEGLQLLLGAFDFKNGVMHRQQALNNEIDVVKMETLETLRKILAALEGDAIRTAISNGEVVQTTGQWE